MAILFTLSKNFIVVNHSIINTFKWKPMKRMFVAIWFLYLGTFLYAQSTPAVYYFTPDVIAIKTVYNAKNEVISRLEYTMLDVKHEHSKSIAQGKTVRIKNNKETETIVGRFLYDGTQLLISMGKMVDGKDAWLDYSSDMASGQNITSHLEFETEAKFIGQTLKICCKISDRKVLFVGEKVSTRLGTWDCIKTGYNMSLKSKTLGIAIPMDVYVEEWFVDGLGIVRTDVYRSGKLYERRLLTEFKRST